IKEVTRKPRRLLPRLPPREEKVGVRRAAPTPMKSPHPNPLSVRRGEGEDPAHSLGFLNSMPSRPQSPSSGLMSDEGDGSGSGPARGPRDPVRRGDSRRPSHRKNTRLNSSH